MKFIIEQIALAPPDPEKAKALLGLLGLTDWVEDVVEAAGTVGGRKARNIAELSFNYQAATDKPLELEIIQYKEGGNWLEDRMGLVSHLGMHVTPEELDGFRTALTSVGIEVAQEVFTIAHTNPEIKDRRRYNYVIFDTREIIGVDLKFIVRYDQHKTLDTIYVSQR
jgi:hypothetical protein